MRKFKVVEAGRRLWHECVKVGIEARKLVLNHCELIRPFIPTTIKGKNGKIMTQKKLQLISNSSNSTQQIHGINLEGYADEQYFVDPCKFLLTTPGISLETGEYENLVYQQLFLQTTYVKTVLFRKNVT